MNKINIKKWKKFHLYDEHMFNIDMGNKFDKSKMDTTKNDINFVGRTGNNNGINATCGIYNDVKPYPSGLLTLALGGSVGSCFIQQKPFYTSQNVIVLIPKDKILDNAKQFVATVIQRESELHYQAFVKELNAHVKTDFVIPLPTNEKDEPDWEYMESYMKNIMQESEEKLENLQNVNANNNKVESAKWKDFIFGKIFQMQKQKEISPIYAYNKNTQQEIKYPFYGQSSENNGIISYISLEDKTLLNNKENKPIIMIHSNNHLSFYVNSPFYLKDGHGATSLFTNKNLNEYNVFFIISVLNKTMEDKFDYSLKATKEKLNSLKIKLPVDDKDEPDWDYMENYMKNIMQDTQSKLDKLVCC